MLLNYLIDGIIIGFSASVPLGPIGVLCIQRTLNKGRLSGFISGLGAAFSDTIYAILAGFSLSYIVNFIEQQLLYIQIFGALLLILLGIHIFYSNPAVQLRKQRKGKSNLFQDFISTFIVTISNPLAIFLFLAFFASFGAVKPGDDASNHFILIAGVLAGASLWWFILSSLISLFRSKINLRRLWWLNKITGAAIVILVVIGFVVFLFSDAIK
ncbi:Threonine/homoserine/homoserine lactone efflux protein [Saccharicrinis carchari]|uniref:Threonine/homoserine/homoserine lactone efflux protein n=1 Tax=Saccharicrinis carchari TaxID=1168039 RepID=A0A521ES86_SACCC|nr:LysE family transporter [Saccharicrinis carchari]SMO85960.1 Threonine/homoserine/homoserine lactone efflux protein [Saccharicrinis carchari]